jgi:dolichyl-phosphate-mannose-protein mannosyltransferase
MWTSNNALTPDPDREPDQLTSSPYQWPLLLVGLRMCGWGDSDVKFYLLGHPLIWWGSTASVAIFAGLVVFYLVRSRRKLEDWASEGTLFVAYIVSKRTNNSPAEQFANFYFAGKVGFLGWVLHYFPFWIMGRVT